MVHSHGLLSVFKVFWIILLGLWITEETTELVKRLLIMFELN